MLLDILQTLKDTPLPSILVIGGLVFLLLPFIKRTGGDVEIETSRRGLAALIGIVLLLAGVALYALPVAMPSSALQGGFQKQEGWPQLTGEVNMETSEGTVPSFQKSETLISLPSPIPTLTSTPYPTPFAVCPGRIETGTGQTIQMQISVPSGQVAYYGGWGFDGKYGGFFVTFNGPYEGIHRLHDGVYCSPVPSNTEQAEATSEQILNECAGRCPTLVQFP